jgi:hypothetical protein
VFICCYFDQEDRDCVVCKKHMHYSVWIFLTKGVFVVNFCKNSSATGVCGTSLLGRRGGENVNPVDDCGIVLPVPHYNNTHQDDR